MEVIYPLSPTWGTWPRRSQWACFTLVWPKQLVQGWAQNPRDPTNVRSETWSRTKKEALSFCWDRTLAESEPGIVHFLSLHEKRLQQKRKPTQKRRKTTGDIIWAPGSILSQGLVYPSRFQLHKPIILPGLSFRALDNFFFLFSNWQGTNQKRCQRVTSPACGWMTVQWWSHWVARRRNHLPTECAPTIPASTFHLESEPQALLLQRAMKAESWMMGDKHNAVSFSAVTGERWQLPSTGRLAGWRRGRPALRCNGMWRLDDQLQGLLEERSLQCPDGVGFKAYSWASRTGITRELVRRRFLGPASSVSLWRESPNPFQQRPLVVLTHKKIGNHTSLSPTPRDSTWVDGGLSLRMCVSNTCPGKAAAAGPENPLWEPRLRGWPRWCLKFHS